MFVGLVRFDETRKLRFGRGTDERYERSARVTSVKEIFSTFGCSEQDDCAGA
jgi:hypothetical protein